MIKRLIKAIIKLIMNLTTTLITPISDLIDSILPDLTPAYRAIASFFDLAGNTLGFCVDMLGLSSTAINLIVLYFTIKLTYPIVVAIIKLAIKWYNALKL